MGAAPGAVGLTAAGTIRLPHVDFMLDSCGTVPYCPTPMADHYAKLWASILDSSVWREPDAHRIVWIAMLAMKDKNGFVGASIDGLARRANVTEEQAESAVASFLAPDPRSRSQEHEGRRIKAVPRGWHILNHDYFQHLQDREMLRQYERERKAERRARVRMATDVPDTSGHGGDSAGHDRDTTGHSAECPPVVTGTGTASEREKKGAKRPADVDEQTWTDWLEHRRKLKAPLSATGMAQMRTEAGKAGMSLQEAMATAMASGWRGFRADYVRKLGTQTAEPPRNVTLSALPQAVIHDPDDPACECERCYTARRRAAGYGEQVKE